MSAVTMAVKIETGPARPDVLGVLAELTGLPRGAVEARIEAAA